jgi:hypothetical protein
MSIFSNPFFSVQGQKERLTNVFNVLNPFDKDAIGVNIGSTHTSVPGLKTGITAIEVAALGYGAGLVAAGSTAAVGTTTAVGTLGTGVTNFLASSGENKLATVALASTAADNLTKTVSNIGANTDLSALKSTGTTTKPVNANTLISPSPKVNKNPPASSISSGRDLGRGPTTPTPVTVSTPSVPSDVVPSTGGTTSSTSYSSGSYKKRRKVVKSRTKRRSYASKRTKRRGRYTPHTAGKRKDTSMKRIRQTKNGQPYVIMASGKARFISKKSAKAARKKRGGRY